MNSEFAAALVLAQKEMPAVEPDATNPHFRSKFVSLDHLLAKTLPVLNRHGLGLAQFPTFNEHATPTLTTIIFHESGESMAYEMPLFLPKNDPQGQGSALTYARRYALAAALGIASEKDDDAEQATRSAGESRGTTAPGQEPAPAPAPSPAEPTLAERWNALSLADAKTKVEEITDANTLRRLLIVEGERQAPRKTLLAAISKRIGEVEPESGGEPQAVPPGAATEAAVSSPGKAAGIVADPGSPAQAESPPEPNGTLTSLKACLAFIAEQPSTVTNPDAWTTTGVLTGLHANGLGSYGSLEEVPEESLGLVLGAIPAEVRGMVDALGPEQLAVMAAQAK